MTPTVAVPSVSGPVCDQRRRPQGCVFEHTQRRLEHRVLPWYVARRPERIAVRERHQQRPRRAHPFRDGAQELNAHRRDALAFQLGGDQTHGLVAEWSNRNQQGDVDGIGDQRPGHVGSRALHQAPRRGDRAHERQVAMIHGADPTARRQLV